VLQQRSPKAAAGPSKEEPIAVMKIYDRGIGTTGQAEAARTQETTRGGRADTQRSPASQPATADTVDLSSAAGRLRQALDAGAGSRAGRVEALQAAYRSGDYVADSHQTSQAMVREALTGGAA
jgi:anti-sigma28 factor (negative regulator of flagellin synthesis)